MGDGVVLALDGENQPAIVLEADAKHKCARLAVLERSLGLLA